MVDQVSLDKRRGHYRRHTEGEIPPTTPSEYMSLITVGAGHNLINDLNMYM